MDTNTLDALRELAADLPANIVDMSAENLRELLAKRKMQNQYIAEGCAQALKAYYDDIAKRNQDVQQEIRLLQMKLAKASEEQLEVMDLLLRVKSAGVDDEAEKFQREHARLAAECNSITSQITYLENYQVPAKDALFDAFIKAYDALRLDNEQMTHYTNAVRLVAASHLNEWQQVLDYDSRCAHLPNVGKISKHYYRRRPLPNQREQGSGETK